MKVKRKIAYYYGRFREIGLGGSVKKAGHKIKRRLTRASFPARFPNSLHIEISNTCNLSCQYCTLRTNFKDKTIMPMTTVELFSPYIKHVRAVWLSGLAEPLLNKDLVNILKWIKHLSPDCFVGICSNATLLTKDLCQMLVKERLDAFEFSLDGTDAALVDKIRKGSSVTRVIDNIRGLNQVKKENGAKFPEISATTVLQTANYKQLPEIVNLAGEIGVSTLNLNGLEPYTEDLIDNTLWCKPKEYKDLAETVREAASIAREKQIALKFASMIPGEASCPEVATPIILADGDVVPCSRLAYRRNFFLAVEDDKKIVRQNDTAFQKCFGNIHNKELSEIWFSHEYVSFREQVMTGKFPTECKSCVIKHNIICVREDLSAEALISQIEHN